MEIERFSEVDKKTLLMRDAAVADVREPVATILRNVETRGDTAVLEYTERFDGVRPDSMAVSMEECRRAAE